MWNAVQNVQTARIVNPHFAHRAFVSLEKEDPPTIRCTEPTPTNIRYWVKDPINCIRGRDATPLMDPQSDGLPQAKLRAYKQATDSRLKSEK